ncbi:thioesterase family protein [Alteromonas ponticola]|uniref:Thioesterase family protein n=1 Tax=Alteromonas ponticola TaxID=2720613 RepID=A0ABX1R2B1_9ALTE|nr:thioesterase family protein [Alteromonas ponticola]NMH59903.1 thioesterase family protein [Alteromonas ponticola]
MGDSLSESTLTQSEVINRVVNLFEENMPFNQLLGVRFVTEDDSIRLEVPWDDKLTGNPLQKILHGGVTASLLDTIGGLTAILSAVKQTQDRHLAALVERLPTMGTVDMRVDYLRPGRGKRFIATAQVIRKGSRVAVCRMELHNERGDHIAFGTGTYMLG